MTRAIAPTLLAVLCAAPALAAIDTQRPDVQSFATEVAAHEGLDRDWVMALLAQAESKPAILEAISHPAEKIRTWFEYRRTFVTDKRIQAGREFLAVHRALLDAVATRTGVPAEIITALLGVETLYGQRMGGYRVLDALATLAFDYPPRSAFFRAELAQFLVLAHEGTLDAISATGSYAGAFGAPQFMPSSVKRYAVDEDGDGRIDLYGDWADITGSVANYLVRNGWQAGGLWYARATLEDPGAEGLEAGLDLNHTVDELERRGVVLDRPVDGATSAFLIALREEDGPAVRVGFANLWAITRYNRSPMYALVVCELAEAIGAAQAPAVDPAQRTTAP